MSWIVTNKIHRCFCSVRINTLYRQTTGSLSIIMMHVVWSVCSIGKCMRSSKIFLRMCCHNMNDLVWHHDHRFVRVSSMLQQNLTVIRHQPLPIHELIKSQQLFGSPGEVHGYNTCEFVPIWAGSIYLQHAAPLSQSLTRGAFRAVIPWIIFSPWRSYLQTILPRYKGAKQTLLTRLANRLNDSQVRALGSEFKQIRTIPSRCKVMFAAHYSHVFRSL